MQWGKTVRLRVVSPDNSGLLNDLLLAGLSVTHVTFVDDITAELYMKERWAQEAVRLLEKQGAVLEISNMPSVVWQLQYALHRKILLIGLIIMASFWLWLPSRIFFIQVRGNQQVPTRVVLEAAENIGLSFGANRRTLRNERIKNALLDQIPQLQWAGVNTYGSVAVIDVREQETPAGQITKLPSNIVAVRDGIVLSCTVTEGTALCEVGSSVKAGDILISGISDCGIALLAGSAEGEVFAQTARELSAVIPNGFRREWSGKAEITNISILIGKKRINFFKGSGILDAGCVKMYMDYSLNLPGGFPLPVKLEIEWTSEGIVTRESSTGSGKDALLSSFALTYLRTIMAAGEILDSCEEIIPLSDSVRLEGTYICSEMIGKVQEATEWRTAWKNEQNEP